MMTATYIFVILVAIILVLLFVWYYIKQFASITFSNGCTGCGCSIIIILSIGWLIIWFISLMLS